MKKARKILLTLCAALLLVTLSVGATIAYLTDEASVKNTFTVGNVQIMLQETQTDEKGVAVKDDKGNVLYHTGTKNGTEVGNKYHLLPDSEYVKDPTITVLANSEESYVRAIVTVTYNLSADALLKANLDTIVPGRSGDWTWNSKSWTVNTKDTDDTADDVVTAVYDVSYKDTVKKDAADQKLAPLFTKIVIPDTFTNEQVATLAGMTIAVEANAIQASGFENGADEAWAAFDAE